MTTLRERTEQNRRDDLAHVICKTFHEFAKGEPKQFTEADWEDKFAYWRFYRASSIAVENLLTKYKIEAVK